MHERYEQSFCGDVYTCWALKITYLETTDNTK